MGKSNSLVYPLLRGVSALLLGILLVFWSQSAVQYLIMAVGCLFLIPGIFSLIASFRASSKSGSTQFGWSQVLGVGSILFGLCLIISPVFFEKSLMYALGVIVTFAGLSELIQLVAARQWSRVPMGFYVTPVLVMLTGIFILFNPVESANIPFVILGVCCMVYGLSDMVNVIKFRRRNNDVPEAEVVDSVSPEPLPEEVITTEKNEGQV